MMKRSLHHLILLRLLPTLAVILLTAPCAGAVSPYPQLKDKADRFFQHRDWASACALYDLMLEEKADVPSTYGQAIVANAMRHDTAAQERLMNKALDNHVPFDSVFSQVRQWSFHLGHASLYEDFLKNTRSTHPWMRRTIDAQLLRYYTFRRDGEEMTLYSRRMLDGAPDNTGFLFTLASGQMLTGQTAEGLATLERILAIDPRHYRALVVLGNWYAQHPASAPAGSSLAEGYLRRAYALRPTPYVAKLLESLAQPPENS